MLKNFWYALEDSTAVADKPKRVRILGQDLVLFRDAKGKVNALSDLCVHRGAALSDGWVEGDNVVCPYHGWKYNETGACVEIPANKDCKAIPKRARVDSYPTEERYGWIWVFLGDIPESERPPIPHIDIADEPGWRAIRGEFKWDAHYTRVVENGVDIAHAPFVHRNSFGNPESPQVDDHEVTGDDYYFRAQTTLVPPRPKGLWKYLRRERQPVTATLTVFMPNITRLDLDFGKWRTVLVDSNVPVDENTTLTKFISYRNFFTGAWADRDARRRVMQIFHEDKDTVEAIRPELLPYRVGDELHLKSDAMSVAYRKRRKFFLDKGWGIDMEAIRRDFDGKRAVVIPSPLRRATDKKNSLWVFQEVPQATEASLSAESTSKAAVNGTNGHANGATPEKNGATPTQHQETL